MSEHAHVNRVKEWTQRICDEPSCEFYGQQAVQGICYSSEGELIENKALERVESDALEIIEGYRRDRPDPQEYLELLESSFVANWINYTGTLDECVRLRAKMARMVNDQKKGESTVPPARTIWSYWSEQDGYLAGVCLASSAEEARSLAFERLKESRPEEWAEYHPDPSGISVEGLGEHGGSGDGEGRLEL